MTIELNSDSLGHAKALIDAGKVDKGDAWSFTPDDGNAMLGAKGDDWENYESWHLGEDPSAAEDTKARYRYPFGKDGNVYRAAVVAIRQRSAQQGDTAIFDAAGDLLDQIDGKDTDADGRAKPLRVGRMYRIAQIERTDALRQARTLRISFSSETAVQRFFGREVLAHDPGAARMDRMNGGAAPLLFNHNPDDPIGIVEPGSAQIAGDRRGYADITFFDTPRGDEVRSMVSQGLRNVSFGYDIYAVTEYPGDDLYRVIDWEPLEISIVSVPADPSVGVGRADAGSEHEVRVMRASAPDRRTAVRDAAPSSASTAVTMKGKHMDSTTAAAGASADSTVTNDGTQLERLRIRTITDLARQHKIDDKTRDEWIDKGLTVDVASSKVLDILAERGRNAPAQDARVGLSSKEVRNYSLHRAMNAVLAHKGWDKAGLEFEAHKTIRDRLNKDCGENSFFVPVEVQERAVATHEKRELTVATTSAGGYLVETSNQGFIDILRNRSVVMAMGARRLSGLQGNLTVPKQSGAATAYWLSTESTSITESAQAFGQMALSPKNVGAYVEISRQLLLQSSPSAEQITMTDLAAQLGLAVDSAGLNGSGSSGQPTGILNTSGIGSSASGTTLGYPGLIDMQSDVASANALNAACGYVTTPAIAGLLMGRQRFTNTNTPVWDGNMLNAAAAGFNAMSSNQVPSATMIFGDFNQLVVAEWGVLEVEVNPVANFQAGIVGVRAIYSVDIGVRYAGAFSKVGSIT